MHQLPLFREIPSKSTVYRKRKLRGGRNLAALPANTIPATKLEDYPLAQIYKWQAY